MISRFQLKLIACASMLTDHICLVLFPRAAAANVVRLTAGRIAFPLFCFMLCEGFFHTSDIRKYIRNLIIAAVISEPIHDMAKYRTFFKPESQNVIFTLLMALIMYWIIDHFRSRLWLQLLIICLFAAAAQFLGVEYGPAGIAVCGVFYLFHDAPSWLAGIGAAIPLIIRYSTYGALIPAIPLYFYNGNGGRIKPVFKYFFYAFYPAHLAILILIRLL